MLLSREFIPGLVVGCRRFGATVWNGLTLEDGAHRLSRIERTLLLHLGSTRTNLFLQQMLLITDLFLMFC